MQETYLNASRITSTKFGIRIYLKTFDPKKHLLLGTDTRTSNETFLFVYWVPEDIISEAWDLSISLQQFINKFGIEFEFKGTNKLLVSNDLKLLKGELKNFEQELIGYEGKDSFRANYVHLYTTKIIADLNYINIQYLFVINIYKYQFWLLNIEYTILKVREGWYDWVNNISDKIKPDGKSQIEIFRPDKPLEVQVSDSELKEIQVPKIYKGQFIHLIQVVNSLDEKERLAVKISSVKKTCVFCDSSELSNEHIIPDWVKGYFERTESFNVTWVEKSSSESLTTAYTQRITNSKKQNLLGYTDNSVCISCNNEWLSELESEVKGILIINKKVREKIEFSEKESRTLTKWVMKIAFLSLNKEYGGGINIYKNVVRGIKQDEIDHGIYLEVVYNKHYKLQTAMQLGQDLSPNKNPNDSELLSANDTFCQFSLQFGKIRFRLSYLNPSLKCYRRTGGLKTKLIYPKNGKIQFQKIDDPELLEQFQTDKIGFLLFSKSLLIDNE